MDGWMDEEKKKGTDSHKEVEFLNKEAKGGENMAFVCHTTTSIPSVIFPQCYS